MINVAIADDSPFTCKLLASYVEDGGEWSGSLADADSVAGLETAQKLFTEASGAAKDGDAERQPVWLTHLDENPNGAGFLFVADHARSERVADYKRCFELFDGRDETAVVESRARWKAYKAAGHTVVYWQQTPTGGWEKKA